MEMGRVYYHFLQMIVPAVICALYLYYKWKRGKRHPELIACIAAGVILKAFYNFFLVGIMLQGHWYYGPSIVIKG